MPAGVSLNPMQLPKASDPVRPHMGACILFHAAGHPGMVRFGVTTVAGECYWPSITAVGTSTTCAGLPRLSLHA